MISKKYSIIIFSLIVVFSLIGYTASKDNLSKNVNTNESEVSTSTKSIDTEEKINPTLNFKNTEIKSIENYINELKNQVASSTTEKSTSSADTEETENQKKTSGENKFIKIEKPKREDTFYKNNDVEIKWSSSNSIKRVDILLEKNLFNCNGNNLCESFYKSDIPHYIASNIKNNGNHIWTIDDKIKSGKYTIRVRNSDRTVDVGSVSEIFSIGDKNEEITIKYPVENQELEQNKNHTIIWTGGESAFNVKITLNNTENNEKITIANNKRGDGVFIWNNTQDINGKTVLKGDYILKVKSLSNQIKSVGTPITIK